MLRKLNTHSYVGFTQTLSKVKTLEGLSLCFLGNAGRTTFRGKVTLRGKGNGRKFCFGTTEKTLRKLEIVFQM